MINFITQIGNLLQSGRQQASEVVNTILVQTYWHIGQHIVVFEQEGNIKAECGSQLLKNLSRDLTLNYGKGFSRSNLFQIRLFYIKFPTIQTVSGQLTKGVRLLLILMLREKLKQKNSKKR
jgi:hypothetical protein